MSRIVAPRSETTAHPAGAAPPTTDADATTGETTSAIDPATDATTDAVARSGPGGRPDAGLRVVPVKHWGRWAFSAIVAFVILQFLWSLATNPQWQWDVFAEYFFAPSVINGLWLTLGLTVVSGVAGFVLGAVLAVFRLSKSPLLNAAAWWYIWFFRSVPLVVQILVWYNLGYLYPTLGLGTPFTTDFWIVEFPTTTLISAFAAAAIGLSLHQAAYSAEIIRAGILSVDQGQLEAAGALGLPRSIRFFRITLPQAARAIVPNAFNEIIGLVKGTSVVFIVALPELFYTVQVIYNRNQRVIPLLLVAVVWYALITTVLSIAQYYVERRYARGSVRELPPTPVQRAVRWGTEQWNRLGDVHTAADPPPARPAPVATAAAAASDHDRVSAAAAASDQDRVSAAAAASDHDRTGGAA
ncbi:MAG TPA: amino acid ABC transporter permease [Agromyces sp.]